MSKSPRDFLQLASEKGMRALEQAAARSEEFRAYLESEDFAHDLADLGTRLGIAPESLQGDVRSRLSAIARHAAQETALFGGNLTALGLVAGRRRLPALGMALAGAEVLRIAFHCYRIYQERQGFKKAG